MIRIIETASQLDDIATLKKHIAEQGGKVHVAVHPFFLQYEQRGPKVRYPGERDIEKWLKGVKTDRKAPLVVLEHWRRSRDTERRLEELGVEREVYIVETEDGDPRPTHELGSWDFFDSLGIKCAYVGGAQLHYHSGARSGPNASDLQKNAELAALSKVQSRMDSLRKTGNFTKNEARFRAWASGQLKVKSGCVGATLNALSKKMNVVLLPRFSAPKQFSHEIKE